MVSNQGTAVRSGRLPCDEVEERVPDAVPASLRVDENRDVPDDGSLGSGELGESDHFAVLDGNPVPPRLAGRGIAEERLGLFQRAVRL